MSGQVAYTCTVQVRDKRPTHTQNARTIFAQARVKKRVPKHAFARICAHLMRVFPFVIHSHNRPLCCILLHNVAQEVLAPQEHASGKKKLNCAFNARSSKRKEFKILSARRRKKLRALPQTANNRKKFTAVGLTSNRYM